MDPHNQHPGGMGTQTKGIDDTQFMVAPEFIVASEDENQSESNDAYLSDSSVVQTWLGLGLTVASIYGKSRDNAEFAHEHLKNTDVKKLLDFKDPTYFNEVLTAHSMRTALKDQHILVGEKGRFHMDQEELMNRSRALVVAKKLHNEVNSREIDIRINNAVNHYGLGPDNAKKLEDHIKEFVKKNPGKNIDNEILVKATNFKLAQITNSDIETITSKEAREKIQKVYEQDLKTSRDGYLEESKNARQNAINEAEKKGYVSRAGEVIDNSLKGKKITNQDWNYIVTGQKPTPAKPEPASVAPQKPPKPIKISYLTRFKNFRNKIAAGIKKGFSRLFAPVKGLLDRFRNFRNKVIARINSGFSRLFAPIKRLFDRINVVKTAIKSAVISVFKKAISFVARLGTKILAKLGLKALGQAIGQLIGSLLPGPGNAIAAALVTIAQVLGIDELFLKGLVFVFTVFIGIIVIIIILIPMGLLGSVNFTSQETINVPSQNNNQNSNVYKWDEFLGKYLTLDSNRHDNMKK